MFKGDFGEDLEVDLEGESKGDFRGVFKKNMEGGLVVKLRSGPGLVQVTAQL